MAHSGYIESLSKGIRERSTDFRFAEFCELPLPIPSLDEQNRIVVFLDQRTADINATIAKKERLIELLNEQKTILLNSAVTRGLKSNQEFKDSGLPWLGLIPNSWEVTPLAGFMSFISYGFTNPMPTEDDGPYMLTSNDIGDGFVKLDTARRTSKKAFDWKLTNKSKPNRGDILITKDGTLGRTALVETDERICVSQSVALLRPKKYKNSEFITMALRSECYQKKMILDAGGTTIKHIYITRLGKMKIATPLPDEQIRIVEHCKEIEINFHSLIAAENKSIMAMRKLRSAVISSVVLGKIKV
jgi:type I restriction enzyme S subunit